MGKPTCLVSVPSSILTIPFAATSSAPLLRPAVVVVAAGELFVVVEPGSFGKDTFLPGPVKVNVGRAAVVFEVRG